MSGCWGTTVTVAMAVSTAMEETPERSSIALSCRKDVGSTTGGETTIKAEEAFQSVNSYLSD